MGDRRELRAGGPAGVLRKENANSALDVSTSMFSGRLSKSSPHRARDLRPGVVSLSREFKFPRLSLKGATQRL
jgi:hypothetical protein